MVANRIIPGAAARRDGLRIFMFHNVADNDFEAFDRLAGYVKRNYQVLSPDQAAEWISGGRAARQWEAPCLFTFDDGFKSNFRVAVEILDRHDIKALFFVCPGLVGLEGDDQRESIAANIHDGRVGAGDLDDALALMSWDEITQLHKQGHHIGAHGMNHMRLSKLGEGQLRDEIVGPKVLLEKELGADIPWYAYAFGDISSISRQALEIISENYRFCRSGVRGGNIAGGSPFALRADQMDPAAPLAYLKFTMEGGLDYRYRNARQRLDEMV